MLSMQTVKPLFRLARIPMADTSWAYLTQADDMNVYGSNDGPTVMDKEAIRSKGGAIDQLMVLRDSLPTNTVADWH